MAHLLPLAAQLLAGCWLSILLGILLPGYAWYLLFRRVKAAGFETTGIDRLTAALLFGMAPAATLATFLSAVSIDLSRFGLPVFACYIAGAIAVIVKMGGLSTVPFRRFSRAELPFVCLCALFLLHLCLRFLGSPNT